MCLPGSPCFGGSTTPRGCGIDPCFVYKTGSDLVVYNGANLPSTGIDTCNTITVALQKIDDKLSPENLTTTILSILNTNPSLKNQLKTILGI